MKMKKRTSKTEPLKIYLLGIPIILIGVVVCLFVSDYEPKYEDAPLDTIIYSSDRYSESRTAGWRKVDFSSLYIIMCLRHGQI